MPVLTEEAKRAEKMEIGDLVIEIVGKTTRVYTLVSTTKLKQVAYSDTLQGQRFLMFSAPSKEITPAKDFTVARLYKKPENARKIIARYFPKHAASGARVHLYYSGRGPRGLSVGRGEGYFTVALGFGIGESLDELKGIPKLKKHKVNKSSREFKMGRRAFEQGKPNAPALNKKLMLSFKGKTGDAMMQMMTDYVAGWHAANLAAPVPEGLDEVKVRVIKGNQGSAFTFMPVPLMPYWWTGSKWSDKRGEARYYDTAGAKSELGNARAAAQKLVRSLKESDMNERFDPKAAHDYVKGVKDRKRKAYAREYLKAIQGARMPPKPEDFKITAQDAREVEAGFKKIGAPLAASVQRSDPTFEQVARIVARARGAGFSPNRIRLNEERGRASTSGAAVADISTDDYIFVLNHEDEDTWTVAHSVHNNPRLGYQELQTGLSEKAAKRFERKMKARWKAAKVKRFLITGHGHRRVFLPESDEAKTKRIKADVDAGIKDPKNKGRTVAQVLRSMFKGVDEARKWAPVWSTAVVRPWRIADQDGKLLRRPKEGGVHQAYVFDSAKKALAFLKSSKGRKAVTTQESLDEAAPRFGGATKERAFKALAKRSKELKAARAKDDKKKVTELTGLINMLAKAAKVSPDKYLGEDTEETRRKVFVKRLKEEANYRQAEEDRDGDKRCGNCAFIEFPAACQRVIGKIMQDDICDLFKRGVAEDLDEAGAQGEVQKSLLDFVKKLPPKHEYVLADVMRRPEFRGMHFKRLMSAAKSLSKKGLIWYDGLSKIGPPR